MTFTAFMLYLMGGALCLHYSFAESIRPCPAIACKCRPPSITRWITNSNGCRRCSCLPRPIDCPQLNCLNRICPDGFEVENNCPTCRCRNNTFPCKPRICPAIFCEFGNVKDTKGCETCECNPPVCPQIGCPPPEFCPSGQIEYFKDKNNCMKCRCKCPIASCPTIKCANGLATDANGCEICQCKNCPDILCPLACPELDRDQNGCQICRCKAN